MLLGNVFFCGNFLNRIVKISDIQFIISLNVNFFPHERIFYYLVNLYEFKSDIGILQSKYLCQMILGMSENITTKLNHFFSSIT